MKSLLLAVMLLSTIAAVGQTAPSNVLIQNSQQNNIPKVCGYTLGIPVMCPSSMNDTPAGTAVPKLLISNNFTVTPQTVRGIVGAFYGLSTSNSSVFMDIFPCGFNPCNSGINFQDYATAANNPQGGAIRLGLADDAGNSQGICYIAQRLLTFDTVFCMFSHNGSLTYNATGDSMILGQFLTTSDLEIGNGMRVGWDAVNQMAVLSGGGGQAGSGVGAALLVNGPVNGISPTTAFICDSNANCGIGPQKKNATLNPFWVSPAGDATVHSLTTTGLPAGCTQFPCVVFKTSFTNQSAALSVNPIYVPTVAGTYRLSCADYIVTAGTAGTFQCGFTWRSGVTGGLSSSGASNTANMFPTAGLYTQGTIIAHLDGVIGLNFFTNYTGAAGTPIYNVDVIVERLQ